jgi:2,3-bisphosphoglycerate-independent phosphoglycerate mutase
VHTPLRRGDRGRRLRLRGPQRREPGHGRADRLDPGGIQAAEPTDRCLGGVVAAVAAKGGICLVTADHGNAERMLEDDGVRPHTAHTTNLVPLIATEKALKLGKGGELSDPAPTAPTLLGFSQPLQMTGKKHFSFL